MQNYLAVFPQCFVTWLLMSIENLSKLSKEYSKLKVMEAIIQQCVPCLNSDKLEFSCIQLHNSKLNMSNW